MPRLQFFHTMRKSVQWEPCCMCTKTLEWSLKVRVTSHRTLDLCLNQDSSFLICNQATVTFNLCQGCKTFYKYKGLFWYFYLELLLKNSLVIRIDVTQSVEESINYYKLDLKNKTDTKKYNFPHKTLRHYFLSVSMATYFQKSHTIYL